MKRVYIPLIIIALITTLVVRSNTKPVEYETAKVEKIHFLQQVSVTGKVVSAQDVDMSFESGGRVSVVNVKVGDRVKLGTRLSSVDSGDAYASYLRAVASLDVEKAKLAAMVAGNRPEEIAIAETGVRNAQASYTQAKNSIASAIADAFAKSDDAVRSKVDQLYKNPRTTYPEIISFGNYDLKIKLEKQRVEIGRLLDSWKLSVDVLNTGGYDPKYVIEAKNNLAIIRDFLDGIGIAVGSLDSNSMSQTTIDKYRADVSSARSNVNAAISTLNSSEISLQSASSNLEDAKNQLALKNAGSRPQDIDAERAQVKSAQAGVLSASAVLGQKSINAPFDGIITKVDAKVGQIVSPNIGVISMISDAKFEIELFIPEANIAKVKIGQEASVWLDAYGPDQIFPATVTSVDPAETIVNGVATYKTKLQFKNADDRVRSGMTANTNITSDDRNDILSVASKAVVTDDTGKFVYTYGKGNPKGKPTKQLVEVGTIDSKGNIEIKKGLNEGDVVVTNPSKVTASNNS